MCRQGGELWVVFLMTSWCLSLGIVNTQVHLRLQISLIQCVVPVTEMQAAVKSMCTFICVQGDALQNTLWQQKIAGNKMKHLNYIQPMIDMSDRRERQRELKACTTKHVILRSDPNKETLKSKKFSDSFALIVNPEDKLI